MRLTISELAALAGGRVARGAAGTVVDGIAYDSRALQAGQAFVALRDRRDGHDFVDDAFDRGAAVAIVEREVGSAGPLVVVEDSLAALTRIGRGVRERLAAGTVVGVTGSAGKTSTKDLLAAALGAARVVHASAASLNNEIGLPVTLAGTPEDAEALVVEMGARFPGNIAELCSIARPTAGIITNIGLAHAEHLGGRDGIAAVKGELLEALPASGVAVLSADCDRTPELRRRTRASVITAGRGPAADVRIADLRLRDDLRPVLALETPWGPVRDVVVGLRGEHQGVNAALALALAGALGDPLEPAAAALEVASSSAWRMELEVSPHGVTVLNDAYNASPTAVAAALRAFAALSVPGRRIAVLGEMLELGAHSRREHARIGELAVRSRIDLLVLVGAGARDIAAGATGIDVLEVEDAAEAATCLRALVQPGDAVLVKASRAVGLEAVAHALLASEEVGAP